MTLKNGIVYIRAEQWKYEEQALQIIKYYEYLVTTFKMNENETNTLILHFIKEEHSWPKY